MIEKTFIITSKMGMHARPAAMFVQTTTKYNCNVRVISGDQEVDGKSIMGILMLAAGPRSKLKIIISGVDEKKVFKDLQDLFASGFEER